MGTRRIDDFGGYPSNSDEMMDSSVKLKHYKSADGAGEINDYPDTTEEIERDQNHGESKIKKHKQERGYRY